MRNNILYIICCLVTLGLYAQEKQYVLNPVHTDQILSEQNYPPKVFEIDESDLIHRYAQNLDNESPNYITLKADSVNNISDVLIQQRLNHKMSFTLGDEIHAYILSGTFEKLDSFKVMANDYGDFLKHELIKESMIKRLNIPKSNIILSEFNTVIVNIENGKYYLVKPDFLGRLNYISDLNQLSDNSNGIKYKSKKIKVSRTESLVYTIELYESMIQRCKELTVRLIMHNELNKKGDMTKVQITDWKRDIVEAKLLNYRINDFLLMYKRENDYNQEYVNKIMSDGYNDFSETLYSASKYVGF